MTENTGLCKKYEPYILKYMARVFCNFPCVFSEVGKKADFLPDYVHIFFEYAELKAYVFISLPVRILRFRKLFSLLQDNRSR